MLGKKEAIATLIKKESFLRESGTEFEIGQNAAGKPVLLGKNYKVKTNVTHNKTAEPTTGVQWEQLKPGDPKYAMGLEAYKKAKELGVTDKIKNLNTDTPDFEVSNIDDTLKINYDKGGSIKTQLEESRKVNRRKTNKMRVAEATDKKLCVIVVTTFDDYYGMDHTYLSFTASGKVSPKVNVKSATWGNEADMKKSLSYLIEESILQLERGEYAWLFYPECQPTGPDGIFNHLEGSPSEYFQDLIDKGLCYKK